MVNFFDFKKKAITNTVAQNVSILQSEVDTYYLKNESYPVENEDLLSLERPQLIDISKLVDNGFQKSKLDQSKIKEQYYWVDSFGRVWGNTKNHTNPINLLETKDGYSLETIITKNHKHFNVYEVAGYNTSSSKQSNLEANTSKLEKHYKVVSENEFTGEQDMFIQHGFEDISKTYLFSFVDEYGLESAPMGKLSGGTTFKPLIKMEGEYEFEIESADTMYWIDFQVLEETPGKSTIDYLFTVKDENRNYQDEWTKDYFSLDPSKGIKVKVVMKGDDEGNKPSLYDLRIIFKYEDDPTPPILVLEPEVEDPNLATLCPNITVASDFNRYSSNLTNGVVGNLVYGFKTSDVEGFTNADIPSISFNGKVLYKVLEKNLFIENGDTYEAYTDQDSLGKCMYVVYKIEINSFSIPSQPTTPLCGIGGSFSYTTNNEMRLVYSTYLEKGIFLTKLERPNSPKGWVLKSVKIITSHKGQPFEQVSSISEIKDESCVQTIYTLTSVNGYAPPENSPSPPPISVCEGENCAPPACGVECEPVCKSDCGEQVKEPSWCELNPTASGCIDYCLQVGSECVPPVCTTNCLTAPPTEPDPNDKVIHDPKWETVDRLRFFGHGAQNQLTRWYKAEHTDSINTDVSSEEISLGEDVRIVYRYAKSSGSYWSGEYVDFSETGHATSVMATAYIQVRTSKVDQVEASNYPTVNSIRFFNEKGYVDASMVQPSLVIIPVKDNNPNREDFSDESNIEWTYAAFDPRNKAIVDIEWDGDKRTKYPVGVYEVKARVKNDVAMWSEWFTYILDVKQEQPIAVITSQSSSSYADTDTEFSWSMAKSVDPDGDKIVSAEWKNKKTKYPIGEHTISLRVVDSEGYWSDWVNHTIVVKKKATEIFTLQSEAIGDKEVYTLNSDIVSVEGFEEGKGRHIPNFGSYVQFTFRGNGFDVKVDNVSFIFVNQRSYPVEVQAGVYSVRDLPMGTHNVAVYTNNTTETVNVDYLKAYSIEDNVSVIFNKTRVDSDGFESDVENTNFSGSLGQKVKVYYEVDKDSTEKVSIVDSNNKEITVLKDSKVKGGTYRNKIATWDGLDKNKEMAPNGEYRFKFEYTGVEGAKSVFYKAVNLINERETQRLEAEMADPQVLQTLSNGSKIESNSNFSNGKGVRLIDPANSVMFKFSGNGFDVYTDGPVFVFVDTLSYKVDSKGGLFSVRNLPDKDHYVSIYRDASKGEAQVDYLNVYSFKDQVTLTGTKTRIISEGIESPVENNVLSSKLGQFVKFYYTVDHNSKERISVINDSGQEVRFISEKEIKGGSFKYKTVEWDGLGENKKTLPNGKYRLKFEYTGVHGTKNSFEKEVELKNEYAVYRMEAESNLPELIKSGGTVVSGENMSGGKGFNSNSFSHYVRFNFTGNGFDVKTDGPAYVFIDQLSSPIISNGGIFSSRNLQEKAHTVSIYYHSSFNTPSMTVDYLDVYSNSDSLETNEFVHVKTKAMHSNIEHSIENNIFIPNLNQKVKFFYSVLKDSNEKVTVVDSQNQEVATLREGEVKGGTSRNRSIEWNGLNSKNQMVANGKYRLKFEYEGVRGGKSTFYKEVVVSNPVIQKKLEVESGGSEILRLGGVTSVDGKGITLQQDPHYVRVNFTGTGVTIKTDGPARIFLNTLSSMNISEGGIYTISNLPTGSHFVSVYKDTRATTPVTVDYIEIHN